MKSGVGSRMPPCAERSRSISLSPEEEAVPARFRSAARFSAKLVQPVLNALQPFQNRPHVATLLMQLGAHRPLPESQLVGFTATGRERESPPQIDPMVDIGEETVAFPVFLFSFESLVFLPETDRQTDLDAKDGTVHRAEYEPKLPRAVALRVRS